MRTRVWANVAKALRFAALSLTILFGLASILATGGGGGGGGGTSSSGGTGSVAVLVGDGPADDYDHIYVYVTKVSLIPASGTSPGPVVIFQSSSPAGHKVDLLAYRDEDFLLGIKDDVPAGRYEKIRLEVASVEAEGGPCALEMIRLPSGKIDLNPRGGFEVRSGESLAIRLDMDANKSINLHEAGNSGRCIFRPVVFVDIKPGTVFQRCPVNITGTITDLIDRDGNGQTDGFVLNLTGPRGLLRVWLDDDAPVFDKDMDDTLDTPAVLAKGQQVWARGRLDAQARFRARVAVVGDVLTVDGVAQGPVETPSDAFPFLPKSGTGFIGQTNVQLFQDQSLVFRGCDAEVGWDAIAQDVPARVFGKVSFAEPELRAAVVLLRQVEISGTVMSFSDRLEGRNLNIDTGAGVVKTVFVPKDNPIFLEGDGQVALDLVCTGTRVRVLLDAAVPQPTATDVKVLADLVEGTVKDKWTNLGDGNMLRVLPNGQTVETNVPVRNGATIIDQRGDDYTLLDFGQIKTNDQLKIFGLKSGPCNASFEAFVVLVVGP